MNCLLIDIGSTFIKYEVYDTSAKEVLKYDAIPFPEPSINCCKQFIVPTDKIKDAIIEIFILTEKYNCKKSFFSVQMHGFLIKNEDGSFTDYVSWRDKSGNIEGFESIDFNEFGTSLKENLPLVKLALKDMSGEFFTLGSYVSYILTGKNATHITDACASGFYYAESGEHNTYAGNLKMPKAYKKMCSVGNYNGIAIYTPAGDHQISYLGSEAMWDKCLINIGTATQISCLCDVDYPDGKYEKRPYFGEKRLCTVTGLVGGDKLYRNEGKDEFFAQIVDSLAKLPPKGGILLGGGGAEHIYNEVKEKFGGTLSCELIKNNIGMKGLQMMAEQNSTKLGTMLSEVCFSNFPIIAKNCGLDFIIIDNEHGCFDYSKISSIIMNANLIGLEAIVRIGNSNRDYITKLADMGVHGFLLPMTNCSADIEEVVKYAKYSPVGKRGVSTTRAHTLYNPPKLTDYMKSANEEMKIYAQIETKSGTENIDSILKVEGVDGIFIGPNDLSVDLNCIGDKKIICDAIKTIANAAADADKPFGIITGDRDLIDCALQSNTSMISVGSELNMLINGCKKIKETI